MIMLMQMFFAVGFSAAPLVLYVPPIRSLSLFVETIEGFAREATVYSIRTAPRFQTGFRRIRALFMRLIQL